MTDKDPPKMAPKNEIESPQRIEPTTIEPGERIADLAAEIWAAASVLGRALHPKTAASLADLVRIMNTYYSNLIEGHNTRPRDIQRALDGQFDANLDRRNLQMEAKAHVRLQTEIDRQAQNNELTQNPLALEFIRWLHLEFYKDMPDEMVRVKGAGREFIIEPGALRSKAEHEVAVGRHVPPSSGSVQSFMGYFETSFTRQLQGGKSSQLIALALSHHRFNYIHPFPDGNGRVSRLMSHAIAQNIGLGSHGLWSISRGLARGLNSRTDYKSMMDLADQPRQDALDGRGNLSAKASREFVEWFLAVCLDQIQFMSSLFELENLRTRLQHYVRSSPDLPAESLRLLEEALIRGQFERGEVGRITGLADRSAQRVLGETIKTGLLASDTPKGAVSLRFPIEVHDLLFPRLFLET